MDQDKHAEGDNVGADVKGEGFHEAGQRQPHTTSVEKETIRHRTPTGSSDGTFFVSSTLFWMILLYIIPLNGAAVFVFGVIYMVATVVSLPMLGSRKTSVVPKFMLSIGFAFLLLLAVSSLVVNVLARTDRYYLGIDVATPQGVASGVSMVETRNTLLPLKGFQRYAGGKVRMKGEAAYCDLGNGRCVIALLDIAAHPENFAIWPWLAAGLDVEVDQLIRPSLDGRISLSGKWLPTMVYLSDSSDPFTAQLVTFENAEALMGEGYKLDEVWLEMTDEWYESFGILAKATWIGNSPTMKKSILYHFRELEIPTVMIKLIRDF